MLKNWIRKVASYFFSPFFILIAAEQETRDDLGTLRISIVYLHVLSCQHLFFFFFFLVSSAVEAVHGSSSAWCRGQTELKRSGLEAQFCSWQGLWEVMGVGGGREEEQMGGERWPAAMSSKGASWFRGWGEMRKKRKEPVETAAGQWADWESRDSHFTWTLSSYLYISRHYRIRAHYSRVNYFQVWKTPTRSLRWLCTLLRVASADHPVVRAM